MICLEKERVKALRREEDSDYDDDADEEEEEGEGDDDTTGKPAAPLHSLVQYSRGLLSEYNGLLGTLMLPPLPDIMAMVREVIGNAVSDVDEVAEALRKETQLPSDEPCLSVLPPPYGDAEAQVIWQKITAAEVIEDDAKGGKKVANGKPKKSATMTPEQQVLQYRRGLYHSIHGKLLDACSTDMFRDIDVALESAAEALMSASPYSDLHRIATVRSDDLQGKGGVAFISFDGGAFLNKIWTSAFNEGDKRRTEAMGPVIQAAEFGASAVVLIYEINPHPDQPDQDWSLTP